MALARPPRSYGVSSADPRGLRITAVPANCWFAVHPPTSFSPPSESYGNSPPPVVSDQAVPPVRFLASSRHLHRGSARHDGFHPIAAFRPRVFSTPQRLPPPRYLAGLFHPASTSRLFPSGFFPRQEPLQLVAVALPSYGCREFASSCEATFPKPHFRALLP